MSVFNERKEVNQIENKELKDNILDNALAFLVNAKEIETKDFKGIKAQFGYLLMIENHGLEALFKLINDDKVFYFAVQQQTLKLLNITEQQFESVTQHMLDMYVHK